MKNYCWFLTLVLSAYYILTFTLTSSTDIEVRVKFFMVINRAFVFWSVITLKSNDFIVVSEAENKGKKSV